VQKVAAKFETIEPKSHNERIRSIVIASALKKGSSLQDRVAWRAAHAARPAYENREINQRQTVV
jgi:hypothetical protein